MMRRKDSFPPYGGGGRTPRGRGSTREPRVASAREMLEKNCGAAASPSPGGGATRQLGSPCGGGGGVAPAAGASGGSGVPGLLGFGEGGGGSR